MNFLKFKTTTFLLFTAFFFLIAPHLGTHDLRAQSPCSHVLFDIDSDLAVDEGAICQAAEPWAEEGIQVFVFLTDASPATEDEWFEILDIVEAEAGLRSLGAEESFERDALAFEASTTTPWANTVTFGEDLFDTPLDSDAALDEIQKILEDGLAQGDPTAAISEALESSFAITYPGVSPWLVGIVVVAGLGILALVLYFPVIRPAWQRRQRNKQLNGQRDLLQQNVANLLLACERLLEGNTAEESILYQLFLVNGGGHYEERDKQVKGWIQVSQKALADAFKLRQELIDEDYQSEQPLEEQVRHWEMVYLTLVGNDPRILELTNAQLQDLLNPLVILERETEDAQLAGQLDEIQRQIEGTPFKVTVLIVDPADVDAYGILGNVDQVEAQIQELMIAQREAPGLLQEARQDRLEVKEAADQARPFGLTGSQLIKAIEERLSLAEQNLNNGLALTSIKQVETINRDLEIIEDLLDAAIDHESNKQKVAAVLAAGYHPPPLEKDQEEIAADIENIQSLAKKGEYLAVDDWVDELDADSERSAEQAASWQERHLFNEKSLALMQERLKATAGVLDDEGKSAWAQLQGYPPGNWMEIVSGLPAVESAVIEIGEDHLPAIKNLNSMAVQDIPSAEARLAEAGKILLKTERQLQALISRVDEIHAAEGNLPQGIKLAKIEWQTLVDYRDVEDSKIGPEIDKLIDEAQEEIQQAAEDLEQREFISGMNLNVSSRETISAAQSEATKQVKKINRLQSEMQELSARAARDVRRANLLDENIVPQAQTKKSNDLLDKANQNLSKARQAEAKTLSLQDHGLAKALGTAVAAFNIASEAGAGAATTLEEEQQAYSRLRRQVEKEIGDAAKAIKRAEALVKQADAKGAGRQALKRAQRDLPAKSGLRKASIKALESALAEAKRAEKYAQEAERKAYDTIRHTRNARAMKTATVFAGTRNRRTSSRGWSGSSSRPRVSNRSISRRSSSGRSSSRRSSSRGSSRRSRSGGSSRRSSSRGRSRR